MPLLGAQTSIRSHSSSGGKFITFLERSFHFGQLLLLENVKPKCAFLYLPPGRSSDSPLGTIKNACCPSFICSFKVMYLKTSVNPLHNFCLCPCPPFLKLSIPSSYGAVLILTLLHLHICLFVPSPLYPLSQDSNHIKNEFSF